MIDKTDVGAIAGLKDPLPADFCLFCGAAPDFIGVFVPEDPETFGAPKGKTRFVRYCLCKKCFLSQGAQARAEKIIKSELAGGPTTNAC